MSSSQLTKRWHIEYKNGFAIECYRQRKPTRLADSWAKAENPDGSPYGDYTITYHGLFNKQITALAQGAEWIAAPVTNGSPVATKNL
jgi:hypothetical protein